MKETKIYVGLNDSVSKLQRFDTEKYIGLLKKVCNAYHVPFSFTTAQGGYFHESGEYTEENTLILTLIDTDEKVIREIARDLCVFFHQEAVLVTEGEVKACYVQEKLDI